jgi:glycine cleavage system H protein
VARIQDHEFPESLFYDLQNQVWYERLPDGLVRAGFTPLAMMLAGDVLVFTPKRTGRDFEKNRSFATIECGKWIGSARAAFDGIVVASNETLMRKPELLNTDAFGAAWMIVARPSDENWSHDLITGPEIAAAFEAWLASAVYKDRSE